MTYKLVKIFFTFFLFPVVLSGQPGIQSAITDNQSIIPVITGPVTPCLGSTDNVYLTEPWKINYVWTVSAGGTITAGGTSTENSVTITWNTSGPQTVSVTYNTATGTGVLDVDVQPTPPVGVTITPSANPVCAGTPVTFTAVATNGGTLPFYSWFVNGMDMEINNQSYTYTPLANDTVHCQVTSELPCVSGNPATSEPIIMTVIANFQVNVTVSASANPSCEGNQVTYSAVAFNGGSQPGYQWINQSGIIPGATSATYQYIPVNGDILSCQLTSNLNCTTGNPATSSPMSITVSPNLPVGIGIVASANPVCTSSPVTFAATPVNGGLSPVFSWAVNGGNVGTNSALMNYTPVNGDVVTCTLNSNAVCKSGNPAISNPVSMVVEPYQLVTISISPSENPVCNGSQVTLTAITANGGNTPHYQWTRNGVSIVHDNPVYTYTPSNGDQINCTVSSDLLCATGNPALSNTVTITVSPAIISSVSITASGNPSCAGTPITFTAHAVNGGTNPVFEWLVNNTVAVINGPQYTYTPLNGDVVFCRMTTNVMCSQGSPVTSNLITVGISPALPVAISISTPLDTVCEGSTVTYTAIPVNGGINPVYLWKVNGIQGGSNSASFSYIPLNGDIITCNLTSSLTCAIGNPAVSNAISMTVSQSLPVSVDIVDSSNPSCVGQEVTFTATSINGGTSPSYAWRVNGVPTGTSLPILNHTPVAGDVILCYITSSYGCASGNPAVSNQITMQVNPNLPVSISISTLTNPSCQGSPVIYNATTVNGGSTPAYQWLVNGSNAGSNSSSFNFVPSNGNKIKCRVTSSISCPVTNPVLSDSITQVVNPILQPAISIVASANPVCTGTEVTFTATPVNGGTSPVYQWKRNGVNTSTGPVLIYTPMNGDVITCKLTSSLMCVTGNQVTSSPITMTVSPQLTPSVQIISSPDGPFCQGATVNFSATSTNGGTFPGFQWLVNGLPQGTSPVFSYSPADGDYVTCRLNSSLACASPNPVMSNPIYMIRDQTKPVSVSISVAENPVCEGSQATFNATPVNGGTLPTYVWKVGTNVMGTGPTFSYVPSGGDMVTCVLTSNATCVTGNPAISDPITMLTTSAMDAAVTISTLTNPFCLGTSVIFRAVAANGGTAPSFQWKVNGMNAGFNNSTYSYVPSDGDVISCEMITNATCFNGTNPLVSNLITMIASSDLPAAISITASATTVCQGTSVQYSAAPVNGGETPQYQWKVDNVVAGSNKPVFVYTPDNLDVVNCQLTSSLTCASGNPASSNLISMAVNSPEPVSVSVIASANPVCQGSEVTLTALPVNGGSGPVYHWRVNGLMVGTNSPVYTYTPQNGDVVTVTLTSNAICISNNPCVSNSLLLTVTNEQPVDVTISASENPFCTGSQIVYTAVPANGGTNPAYQWFVNGLPSGTNNSVFIYTPANGDKISCRLTSNQTCINNNPAMSDTITMDATAVMPVVVAITASQTTPCAGALIVFTATVTNGGTSPFYQWKVNGVNKGPNHYIYQFAPLNGDVVSCVVTSNLSCATNNPATSNAITMTVNPSAPVSISIVASQNPSCQGTLVTFTATTVNAGSDPLYRWKVNGVIQSGTGSNIFSYVPQNNDKVMCRMTSNQLCATNNPANSDTITMNILPYETVGVAITASGNPVCQGTQVTFTAIPTNGGSAPSYQWKLNGVNAGTNSSVFLHTPVQGDVVSCVMSSNMACVLNNTANSNAISMMVSPLLPASVYIVPSSNPVCQGSVTFHATPTNGGPFPAYQWKVNGSTSGTNSAVFTYSPVNNDVVTCILTSSAACIYGSPDTSNLVTLMVNQSYPVGVDIVSTAIPPCQGQTITFTATSSNGGTSPFYQWMVNGMYIGQNSPVYSYIPNDGDIVACQVTSNITCATGNPALSNTLVMDFEPVLPVSISITCSANPACLGTPAVFNAIVTNPGNNPVYLWTVNGTDMGVNLPQFSYSPVNGDVVVCTLNSDIPCPLNNPVTSNSIMMSVLPPQSAGVTIATNTTTVCVGTLVNFTSVAINPGSAPLYQWKVNGLNAGGNSSTFAYVPANGDVVSCNLTSSVSCITNNPVVSNAVTMSVSSAFPASISITASANPSCLLQDVTFTSNAVNGGPNPQFQWRINGMNVSTNSTYTYTPTTGQVVTCEMISAYSCATGSPAMSNAIEMIVNPNLPVGVSVLCSSNPACSGTSVSYTATPVNGGATPAYQWKVNGVNVGTSSPVFTYQPLNNDAVVCEITSSEGCTSGNPARSDTINMIIRSSFTAGVIVSASAIQVCVNTPVTFTATNIYGGLSPQYQWKVNAVNVGSNTPIYTYFPNDNDAVTCTMTSSLTCATGNPATSTPLNMIVLPIPVGITIDSDPDTAVCAGTPVNFTAFPLNGGPGPTFQWMVNGAQVGPNSPNFTYPPVNGDEITCMLMSNAVCASGSMAVSNTIASQVNPNYPVGISVQSDHGDTVCNGTSVVYTATSVNPGALPLYLWTVNGVNMGLNDPVFIYSPANGDKIVCTLVSDMLCATGNPATSDTIAMTVNPVEAVSVTISASANAICQGTQVNFAAVGTNGGPSPVYQWQLNGGNITGATNISYAYVPDNNDVITCSLNSSVVCPDGNPANSNAITMIVNPLEPVSIIVTASETTVCEGNQVNFNSVQINGGSTPGYQWQVNGLNIAGATNSTFSVVPSNNDAVGCVLTSNAICPTGSPANSNAVVLTVNPLEPLGIIIAASSITVCEGEQVVLTSSVENGGIAPGYQWQLNGVNAAGATNASYTFFPVNNDVVTCLVTSSAVCPTGSPALSNAVTISVYPGLPISIAITADPPGDFCYGSSVTFNASAVNGGSNPVYQWLVNGANAGTNNPVFIYQPADGDVVRCRITSLEVCTQGSPALSNEIIMAVNLNFPVSNSVSANPPGSVCSGIPVTFTATPVNGGSSPQYQWMVNGVNVGTGQAQFTYQPENLDIVSCVVTSNLSCATGNPAASTPLTVVIRAAPVVTYSTCQDPVTAVNAKPFRLRGGIPLGGVYSGPGVNSVTGFFDPASAGPGIHQITYTYTTIGLCEASAQFQIDNRSAAIVSCGSSITDFRDNKVYPTVQIGSQCWMGSNLNYGVMINSSTSQTDNCVEEKYCRYDSETFCAQSGGFYQWDELMRYETMAGGQGFCPAGWHIPTESDWNTLLSNLGGPSTAGAAMKTAGAGSFNALLGGVLYQNKTWAFQSPAFSVTFFWTSESLGATKAGAHGLNNTVNSVSNYSSLRENGFQVRCLLD